MTNLNYESVVEELNVALEAYWSGTEMKLNPDPGADSTLREVIITLWAGPRSGYEKGRKTATAATTMRDHFAMLVEVKKNLRETIK